MKKTNKQYDEYKELLIRSLTIKGLLNPVTELEVVELVQIEKFLDKLISDINKNGVLVKSQAKYAQKNPACDLYARYSEMKNKKLQNIGLLPSSKKINNVQNEETDITE